MHYIVDMIYVPPSATVLSRQIHGGEDDFLQMCIGQTKITNQFSGSLCWAQLGQNFTINLGSYDSHIIVMDLYPKLCLTFVMDLYPKHNLRTGFVMGLTACQMAEMSSSQGKNRTVSPRGCFLCTQVTELHILRRISVQIQDHQTGTCYKTISNARKMTIQCWICENLCSTLYCRISTILSILNLRNQLEFDTSLYIRLFLLSNFPMSDLFDISNTISITRQISVFLFLSDKNRF